ncbi:hypothetical protein M3Y95_01041600 [Aphelenchoides besseyi]|nr:hypothetical protein M3Y95_01041600 [Aphelenchoides besseyi]
MFGLIVVLALCVGYAFALRCYVGGIGTISGHEVLRNISVVECPPFVKCLFALAMFNVLEAWTLKVYSCDLSELPDSCIDSSNSTAEVTYCACSTDLCNTKFLDS